MTTYKAPRQEKTEPPNPLDFPVKDPLREAYQGRWKQLLRIQKVGLIVQLLLLLALIATVIFAAGRARSLGSLIPVVVVATILGLLLLALRRNSH